MSEDDLHHKIIDTIKAGEDPKEFVLEWCKPLCLNWKDKVTRCEAGLKIIKSADPEKSCIYRYRQWTECVENCVQPKIWHVLKGASDKRKLDGMFDAVWPLRYLFVPLYPVYSIATGLARTQVIEGDCTQD